MEHSMTGLLRASSSRGYTIRSRNSKPAERVAFTQKKRTVFDLADWSEASFRRNSVQQPVKKRPRCETTCASCKSAGTYPGTVISSGPMLRHNRKIGVLFARRLGIAIPEPRFSRLAERMPGRYRR